jgi:hypothetical protein
MELDAEVQHCNTALQRLAHPSNPLLNLLKQIGRFLQHLSHCFW